MDGTALTMPIVFEDSYVSSFSDFFSTADSISSSNFSSNESFNKLGSEKSKLKLFIYLLMLNFGSLTLFSHFFVRKFVGSYF